MEGLGAVTQWESTCLTYFRVLDSSVLVLQKELATESLLPKTAAEVIKLKPRIKEIPYKHMERWGIGAPSPGPPPSPAPHTHRANQGAVMGDGGA